MDNVTQLINEIEQGKSSASDELLPLIYEELRRLAKAQIAEERPGQTLQPTALVHEAYLRLVGSDSQKSWDGRGHFFAAAAEAMRRILVENARRKKRIKHGGAVNRVELTDGLAFVSISDDDMIALDQALEALTQNDPESANVVKLHFFAGLTHEQIGQALGFSERKSERRMNYAKAWLRRRIKSELVSDGE
jgi:RNA polymerase sigma factor (TIGR02999 family)